MPCSRCCARGAWGGRRARSRSSPRWPPPTLPSRPAASSRGKPCSMSSLLVLLLAASVDAETILRNADKAVLGETAAYMLRMTVMRPGKNERVVEMKGWKRGDTQGLVRYTSPPKERGTAYLRNGEST